MIDGLIEYILFLVYFVDILCVIFYLFNFDLVEVIKLKRFSG